MMEQVLKWMLSDLPALTQLYDILYNPVLIQDNTIEYYYPIAFYDNLCIQIVPAVQTNDERQYDFCQDDI